MNRPKTIAFLSLTATCATVLLAGCRTGDGRKWLSVFFDGVPSASSPGASGAKTPSATTNSPGVAAAPAKPATEAKKESPWDIHKPYQDNNCLACHESQFAVTMRAPLKEVCFTCHKEFLAKKLSSHEPFDNGECLSCHNPHYTTNKFLLVKKTEQLCADCHDPFVAKPKSIHEPYQNGECLSCHDAHASTNKFLVLKSSTKSMCFDCHDDFLAAAKFTHDAVDDCNSCHNPHESANKSLLTKERQALCFDCHEEKDMAAVKGHANMGKALCVDCHDPHVGADKNLLKLVKTAAKLPPPKS